MSHDVVNVAVEEDAVELLCEVVRKVLGSIHTFQENKVTFNPITDGKITYVDVTSACSWFASISHCSSSIIVFVDRRSSLLRDVQVVENAACVEQHFSSITGSHKFRFRRGHGNSWLESRLVCNCTAGESEANTSE